MQFYYYYCEIYGSEIKCIDKVKIITARFSEIRIIICFTILYFLAIRGWQVIINGGIEMIDSLVKIPNLILCIFYLSCLSLLFLLSRLCYLEYIITNANACLNNTWMIMERYRHICRYMCDQIAVRTAYALSLHSILGTCSLNERELEYIYIYILPLTRSR